jgi:hypothetical protein
MLFIVYKTTPDKQTLSNVFRNVADMLEHRLDSNE